MNNLSFRELVATKPIDSYSQDQIKNIKLLSTSKHGNVAIPFGSATYRIQKYPGDLDLYEIFVGCCSIDDVIKKFEKIIKKIAKEISKNKLHYFSEFKAGLDKRYNVDLGEIHEGLFNINRKGISKKTKELAKKNLLSKTEVKVINKILKMEDPSDDEYDILFYIFRNKRILRWSQKEILQSFKMLPGNVKMTLNKALHSKTHVKLDMIAFVNNKFVEVTNFWILALQTKNGLESINLDYNFNNLEQRAERYDVQIKEDIEKMYYSDMYYSPFKMAKRMWAYARFFHDEENVKILLPLISGNISMFYQIKSELEAIERVFELRKVPPLANINKQVDEMKVRIANVLLLSEEHLQFINSLIDKFVSTDFNTAPKKTKKVKLLDELISYIKRLINIYTIVALEKIGYNPPPMEFLPDDPKYELIVRTPEEFVVNPLNKYIK